MNKVLIITGPTASGKTGIAIEIAKKYSGEIINGDSLQLYKNLRILSARPTSSQEAAVPHHLYGILEDQEKGDLFWWYQKACEHIQSLWSKNHLPVIVGGTGMYLKSLSQGVCLTPPISNEIKDKVMAIKEQKTSQAFYDYVTSLDPLVSDLKVNDSQRLTRALEVFFETHQSIRVWQNMNEKILDCKLLWIVVMPDKKVLEGQINTRLKQMMEQGAIDEVEKALTLPVHHRSSLKKAIGFSEIESYLKKEMPYDDMLKGCQIRTRQYVKRQKTWIKTQIPGSDQVLIANPSNLEEILKTVDYFISS